MSDIDLDAEVARLQAAVERVQALHAEQPNDWWQDGDRDTPTFGRTECAHDFKRWPCPTITALELSGGVGIYDEIRAERQRAHAKHGDTSMEAMPADSLDRLAILLEEVGEVAREFNEARHDGTTADQWRLRHELIQVAAMATAWADNCDGSLS
jgi:NTP pyrophosphatase (non-canonical NTP hydrolase)